MSRLATLAIVVLGAGVTSGCIIERYERVHRDEAPQCAKPRASAQTVWIEPDEALAAEAGEGAGVFLEYESGGRWHAWVTCDTRITGRSCKFDVFAQVINGNVGNIVGESLGPRGRVYHDCADSVQLVVDPGESAAGVYFDAPPGAAVQFDILLDGAPYPELVYWYGHHRKSDASDVRYGAPGNPVSVVPSRP